MIPMKLNPKQEIFCFEYVKSGNATAAYSVAYGTTNESSAAAKASALLRKPNIQERLTEIQSEIASEKIASATEVQERLSAIARREITEEVILSSGERVQRQVAIKDVLKALEILCKIHGLFISRQELNVKGCAPVVIAGADCLLD